MKTSTTIKKLGRFRTSVIDGVYYVSSRSNLRRMVKVHPSYDNDFCLAYPIVFEEGSQRVAFHAKTTKSLVEFLEGK